MEESLKKPTTVPLQSQSKGVKNTHFFVEKGLVQKETNKMVRSERNEQNFRFLKQTNKPNDLTSF